MAAPEGERAAADGFRAWVRTLLAAGRRRPALAAAGIAALAYLPFLAAGPIRGALEANRLQVAREMLATGDWIVPRINGELYLAKPPGQPWAIAVVSLPFGRVSTWSGRLVSALCTVLAAAWTARWCARALGPGAAAPAGVALAACGVLLEKGQLAELEAPLLLTTAGALFLLWRAASERAWRLAVLSGLCLGASILVKGPVGLLPVGLCGAVLIAAGPERGRRAALLAAAAAVAALVAVPWFAVAIERLGYGTWREVFHREVLQRVPNAGRTNREPLWYYVYALPMALGPVALLLPAAWVGARAAWRRDRALGAFLAAWAVGTIALLSVSSGKELRYLLVALPAWAAWIGLGIAERAASPRLAAYLRGLATAAAVGLPALAALLGVAGWVLFPAGRAHAVAGALLLLGAWLAIRIATRIASRGAAQRGAAGSAVPAALVLCALILGLRAVASAYLLERKSDEPLEEIGAVAARYLAPGEPLLVSGRYSASLHFALDRPLIAAEDEAALAAALARGASPLLLVKKRALPADLAAGWEELGAWGDPPLRLYRRR